MATGPGHIAPALRALALGLAAALAGPGSGQAAPITTNTAIPVSEGSTIVRKQIVITRAAQDPAGLGRAFDAIAAVAAAGYGLSGRTTLFGVLPYARKRLETPAGKRASTGFGDARIFLRHTVIQRDTPGRTVRFAPLLGLELPTGEHNARDRLGLKPADVQPGSGSLDVFAGAVFTYATLDWHFDAQALYQENREHGGREDGDVARGDVSLQYRLWPEKITPGTPAFLFGAIEANLIHAEKTRIGGAVNPDTGGATLFLAPGLQYATRTWIAEAAVQIPVWQERNGRGLEKDYILRAGLRRNF